MHQNYYAVWKSFNKFFVQLDVKPKTWEDRLVLFVGHLIQRKLKSNTIKSYISAIRSVLSDDDIELNVNQCLLTSLTKACKIVNDTVELKIPIKKPLLKINLQKITILFSDQPYLDILYRTLFTTMYFGLFRIGEVTHSPHVVQARNVHVATNKRKMMFILFSSKTHGSDKEPQIIKITSQVTSRTERMQNNNSKDFCPYELLRTFLAI